MLVVIPLVNTPLLVTQTDVGQSANDPSAVWDEETFYYAETNGYEYRINRVVYNDSVSKGEIYSALYDNIGINPKTQTREFWSFEGYTNEYAFLSRFPENRTLSTGTINFSLGNRILFNSFIMDTVGFFGLEGESLALTVNDGNGGTVHTSTTSLESWNTIPPGTLFKSGYHRRRSVVKHLDSPVLLDMDVSLAGSGLLAIGGFCAGVAVYAGLTQISSEISMTQNLVSRTLSGGFITRDAGRSVIRHSLIVTCSSDNLDKVMDLYDGLAGVPTMYRMTAGFEYHWIYGMWTNFTFLYSNGDLSYYTVEIETTAHPQSLPAGYNMPQPA